MGVWTLMITVGVPIGMFLSSTLCPSCINIIQVRLFSASLHIVSGIAGYTGSWPSQIAYNLFYTSSLVRKHGISAVMSKTSLQP